MKMSKNYKRICLVLGLSAVVGASTVAATSGTKNIQATYRNIGVTYNGASKPLAVEPFAVDGSVYVPLRGISEILGAEVNWNGSTNTVSITNTAGDTSALQQELSAAKYNLTLSQLELSKVQSELTQVKSELTKAKEELESYKSNSSNNKPTTGTDITTAQLQASENALYSEFANYFSDISFDDFDIRKSSSRLLLTINYTKSNYDRAFTGRSTKQIDLFLESVCDSLSKRHPGLAITGTVTYNSTERYNFNYSQTGSYSGEAIIQLDQDEIEDFILNDYSFLSSSSIDHLVIRDADVILSDSKETITASLYLKTPSTEDKEKWNNRSSDKDLKNDLADIAEAIQNEYNTSYEVTFYLYDDAARDSRVASWRNGSLSLLTWK